MTNKSSVQWGAVAFLALILGLLPAVWVVLE